MLNGKYIALPELFHRLTTRIDIDEELPIDDLILWAYETLNSINAEQQFVIETTSGDYCDFQIELPCNFHSLKGLSIDGIVPVYSSNIFHELMDKDCCNIFDGQEDKLHFFEGYFNDNLGKINQI